jgi:hypothetical protein
MALKTTRTEWARGSVLDVARVSVFDLASWMSRRSGVHFLESESFVVATVNRVNSGELPKNRKVVVFVAQELAERNGVVDGLELSCRI